MFLFSPEISTSIFTIEKLLSQFFFIQYNHNYQLNGVFWTLGIEVQFYLLIPILILIHRKFKKISIYYHFVFYFLLFLIPISNAFLNNNLKLIDSRNIIGNLSHFYISFIAIDLIPFFNKIRIKPVFVYILISLILLINTFIYHKFQILFWTFGSLFVDLVIILLIYLHNCEIHFFSKNTSLINKLLEFIGNISFGIYAYHYVAFKIAGNNLLFVSILTLLFSFFSYKIYEPLFIRQSKLLIYK